MRGPLRSRFRVIRGLIRNLTRTRQELGLKSRHSLPTRTLIRDPREEGGVQVLERAFAVFHGDAGFAPPPGLQILIRNLPRNLIRDNRVIRDKRAIRDEWGAYRVSRERLRSLTVTRGSPRPPTGRAAASANLGTRGLLAPCRAGGSGFSRGICGVLLHS